MPRTACFGSLVTPVLSNLFNPSSNPRSGRLARIYKYLAVPGGLVSSVTAEVAGSSPVVPAILSTRVRRVPLRSLRARKGRTSRPFVPFLFGYAEAVACPPKIDAPFASEEKTNDTTAACAACLAGVIACV